MLGVLGGSPGSKQKGPPGGTSQALAQTRPWPHLLQIGGLVSTVSLSLRANLSRFTVPLGLHRSAQVGTSSSCRAGSSRPETHPGRAHSGGSCRRGSRQGLTPQPFWTGVAVRGWGESHLQWEKGKVSPGPQAAWLREAARSTTSRLRAGEGGRGT